MKTLTLALAAVLMLAGCSSKPNPEQKTQSQTAEQAPPKPDTETGRLAFQREITTARQWAADARPFRLESDTVTDANGQGGKAAIWRGSFASTSRRAAKVIVWSGVGKESERGISSGPEQDWSPTNTSTMIFELPFLKSDSDIAYNTALKHGGDKLLKKDPKTPAYYVLDWDPRKGELIWHVMFGKSRTEPELTIDVDASTGIYVRTEH